MGEFHDRILIVDDEEHVRNLFKRVLLKEGYEVECAASGIEAIEKLEKDSFDLVVTDLKMDKVDGIELLAKGKSINQSLPFIMISGYGTVQTAATAVSNGVAEFLMKPIDIGELKQAVKKVLRK
jgi:ATP-dependent Lon protease